MQLPRFRLDSFSQPWKTHPSGSSISFMALNTSASSRVDPRFCVRNDWFVVLATDIVMDVKFRKYDNTTVSYNGFVYTFSGSYSWVHFNVFTVAFSSARTDSFEGSVWFPVNDRIIHVPVLEAALARVSYRWEPHFRYHWLTKVIVHFINWVFFLAGYETLLWVRRWL